MKKNKLELLNMKIMFVIIVAIFALLSGNAMARVPYCPPNGQQLSNSENYAIDDEDCNKFYQCSNGIAYSMSCGTGLVFNPARAVSIIYFDLAPINI